MLAQYTPSLLGSDEFGSSAAICSCSGSMPWNVTFDVRLTAPCAGGMQAMVSR